MFKIKSSDYKTYSKFVENLAKKLTKFYYLKLNKPFKVSNKLKGKGYDPVTSADKAFEKFIRKVIKKKFPDVLYLIAGKGPYLETIIKKTKEMDLNENVKFLGWITEPEKSLILKMEPVKIIFM